MTDSAPTATQENRKIRIDVDSSLRPDTLLLRGFTLVDELSAPFELTLDIQSLNPDVDFADVIGKRTTVTIELPNGQKRYLTGVVLEFELVGFEGEFAIYRALVVPWLRLLRQSVNCRVFENVQVPEVVQAIFRSAGYVDFRLELTGTYCTRPLVAQYNENDFNLVSRLLESVGIFYYFEHTVNACTVVLCDSHGAARGFPGYESIRFNPLAGEQNIPEHVHEWQVRSRFRANQASVTSYDYEHPRQLLRRDRLAYISPSGSNIQHYEFEDFVKSPEVAENIAAIRAEELLCKENRRTGSSDALGICVGYLFTLDAHPRKDQNINYMVTGLNWHVDTPSFAADPRAGGFSSKVTFESLDASRTFRPARQTPPQKIMGLQTGTVVGNPGEEVNTDELGRVRVRFPWTEPETSTCWVRVAQNWASKGWGIVFLPHVGDEVCVSFINGDPDNPIVTGRVYNADRTPPINPAQNPDVAIIQDKAGNYFKMVSTPGSEEVTIHSPQDDTSITLGPGGITFNSTGNITENCGRNKSETTMGTDTDTIMGVKSEHVLGLSNEAKLGGNTSVFGGLDFELKLGVMVDMIIGLRFNILSTEEIEIAKVGKFHTTPAWVENLAKKFSLVGSESKVALDSESTYGVWAVKAGAAMQNFEFHDMKGEGSLEKWTAAKSVTANLIKLTGTAGTTISGGPIQLNAPSVTVNGAVVQIN